MSRPFRFAVDLHGPFEGRTWADTAREIEDLGYSTVFVPDHFDEGLAPVTAMATAAAVTTTLNVGALVLACDFRHPAVVARELATIDHLSGGRLEVGLGAGWKTLDYERTGMVMDRPGVRVDRMVEHATVLRRLMTEESVTFHGDHYRITDLALMPRPTHAAGPRFLIGGGAPRVLRFAGAFADIVGVNPSIHSGEIDVEAARDGLPERIDAKVGWVREGAGERFEDLEINAWLAVAELTDDRDGAGAFLSELYGVPPEEALASPVALIGSPMQVAEELEHRRERWGYSYISLPAEAARDFAPLVADLTGS